MPPERPAPLLDILIHRGDILFGLITVAVVVFLVIPLPPLFIDLLLTFALALSLMIIMTVIYIREPVQFSGFPTILLFITLFRLSMNVATTRSILDTGEAGHLINAFGTFVIQGNYVVGIVVFLILITINFVVITRGSGRVAEVAARFTLDAMPGKQMSIDSDLNAGLINEPEARKRRLKMQEEADFYGAMDGASKFVRGDAVAGLIIILINILGGLAIGVLQKGMDLATAAQHYTLLTIGDGLVTQIPSLLISTAAGLLVTRTASKENLGQDITHQMLSHHKGLYVVSVIMACMVFIPGFPWWAFVLLSLGFYGLGKMIEKSTAEKASTEAHPGVEPGEPGKPAKPASAAEKAEEWLKAEALQIEIGYNIITFLDRSKGGDLIERVTSLRKNLSSELGIVINPIRIRDNPLLGGNVYSIQLRGSEISRGEIYASHLLAMGVGTASRPLNGRVVTEPVFNLPATWIAEPDRRNAEQLGFAVVDPVSVLITHLAETVRAHAHQLLSRQDTQNLLDQLKEVNAAVVQELIPNMISIGVVHRVLQNLLREGVSIRNLGVILEKVADYASLTKNPDELSEHARKSLPFELVRNVVTGGQNNLAAITLDPELEQRLAQSMRQNQHEVTLALDPGLARHLINQLGEKTKQMASRGIQPLLLCSPIIRLALRRFFEGTFRNLTILAYNELPERTEIQTMGMVPNAAS
ncbi:MAG: flagellar biosynthesis protein FlhA [Verrucomicrobiae bacterium]|nr:flagellar biosynthesis protein FlhA [Verrucomicrobiae bacterium]